MRKGREYLDELLDAVQDGSSYMPLMAALSECHDHFSQPELRTAIGRALDFLEGMRHRIERMLANLIRFVRQCVSYQSFVGSLSRRDTLGRLQFDLLRLAFREPLSMPVVGQSRPCVISLEFSASQNQAPVTLDPAALAALSVFVPEPVRNIQASWRGEFLDEARRQWSSSPFSPRPLAAWIRSLLAAHAVDPDAEILALWYLLNDMPAWKPAVLVRAADAPWEALGPTLMQPVILDTPHV